MSFSLLEIIKEDWQAHSRDWTLTGLRALAFYRFGVWRMQICSIWLRASFSYVYRFLYRHTRNALALVDVPTKANAIGVPAKIARLFAKSDKCLAAVL